MSNNKIGGCRGRIPRYSEEEIQKYLNILDTYKKNRADASPIKQGCNRENLIPVLGQWLCLECGLLKGYILHQCDINDNDRVHYQKKSIYNRKYYFEKKVNDVANLIGLNDDEKSILYERLLEMDSKNMIIVNKKYSRKRIININYIIKKFLKKMGCKKYKNIKLKINSDILMLYNNWWKSYCKLTK